jgi:hypothetical protein
VKPLGAVEDAQDDFVQSWIGPEKIPALNRTAGDFDEGPSSGMKRSGLDIVPV